MKFEKLIKDELIITGQVWIEEEYDPEVNKIVGVDPVRIHRDSVTQEDSSILYGELRELGRSQTYRDLKEKVSLEKERAANFDYDNGEDYLENQLKKFNENFQLWRKKGRYFVTFRKSYCFRRVEKGEEIDACGRSFRVKYKEVAKMANDVIMYQVTLVPTDDPTSILGNFLPKIWAFSGEYFTPLNKTASQLEIPIFAKNPSEDELFLAKENTISGCQQKFGNKSELLLEKLATCWQVMAPKYQEILSKISEKDANTLAQFRQMMS
jgi:hypothetical protein